MHANIVALYLLNQHSLSDLLFVRPLCKTRALVFLT